MKTKNKTIIIFEHSSLDVCNYDDCKNCTLDKSTCFKASKNASEEIAKLCSNKDYNFALNYNNSTIKSTKYTGYFELPDGTAVEILPKIYKNNSDCYNISCINKSRKIFENLLLASSDITKEIKEGTLSSTKGGKSKLLEILITIFCYQMENLLNKGIKKFYQLQEDNLTYLKGKIKFSEHIKRNIVSKEKFFVEYDDFIENIPENRILKSACRYLLGQTEKGTDKKILRRCLIEFDNVEDCLNLEKDLAEIQNNRFFSYYEKPLIYATFFLRKKNFVPNKGNNKLPALFFPLNKMFEEYIEKLLENFKTNYTFKSQSSEYRLLSKEEDKKPDLFAAKPDFIVKKGNKSLVLDAKYKVVNIDNDLNKLNDENEEEKNYYNNSSVSQSDLYQTFAYSEILKQNGSNVSVALLYPQSENFKTQKDYFYFNGTKITFVPIDLTKDKSKWSEANEELKKYLQKNLKN